MAHARSSRHCIYGRAHQTLYVGSEVRPTAITLCLCALLPGCFEEPIGKYPIRSPATLAPIDLPAATHVTAHAPTPTPTEANGWAKPDFDVVLEANGDVTFKGNSWCLDPVDPMAREIAQRALRQELMVLIDYGCFGPIEPIPQFDRVRFIADRAVPWRYIVDIVQVLRDPKLLVKSVSFAVTPPIGALAEPGYARDFVIPAELRPIAKDEVPGGYARLSRVEIGPQAGQVFGVMNEIVRRPHLFPEGDYPKDHDALIEYEMKRDTTWARMFDNIDPTESSALLRIEDGIEYGYVIELADRLLQGGDRTIIFPGPGFAIDFSAPPTAPDWKFRSNTIAGPSLVSWIVIGCLVAAGLTFLPLMRRRRAP